MNRLFTALAIATLTGCAAQPAVLQPGAAAVKLGKEDPAPGYTYVGEVSGVSGSGCGLFGTPGSFADSAADVRNQALSLGADYVQIMAQTKPGLQGSAEAGCYRNTYRIDGTAYKAP